MAEMKKKEEELKKKKDEAYALQLEVKELNQSLNTIKADYDKKIGDIQNAFETQKQQLEKALEEQRELLKLEQNAHNALKATKQEVVIEKVPQM